MQERLPISKKRGISVILYSVGDDLPCNYVTVDIFNQVKIMRNILERQLTAMLQVVDCVTLV